MNQEHRMPKTATNDQTSRTTTIYRTGLTASASESVSLTVPTTKPTHQRNKKDIEAAVYSHIQALRRLGNTRVSSAEIARSLGLTVSNVNAVLPKLSEKGVRRTG
jgi:biotin operon repressor